MNKKTMNKLFLITSLLTISPTVSKAESVYMCEPCPAGYACSNGVKTICPAGTFAYAGARSCTSCADGTYSNKGASSCSSCPTGYKANSSHTGCSELGCTYSFTDLHGYNKTGCNTGARETSCKGYSATSKKGKTFSPYKCFSYTCTQSTSGWTVYEQKYKVTLEHGDSIDGKTCDKGVMR